jgi:bifunctional DNase/RNase
MADKLRLYIKGLSYSQTQTGAYALVLGEEKGERRLPIIIGGFEAQSIAIALEKDVNPPRPLTHDFYKNFADGFDINLIEVVIHKLQDGVFFSILVFKRGKEEVILDARTSDAVALAIRFEAPIYTYAEILDKAGVILNESGGKSKAETKRQEGTVAKSAKGESESSTTDLAAQSLEHLHQLMDKAVENEDYERAARIRDEIDKRNAN